MNEEYLPAEYRVSPKKRSIFNAIRNSSWNFRISSLLLVCALFINLALLISIPIIGNYTVHYNFQFYEAGLRYSFNYHLHYWIMMSLFSLVGSGLLQQSKSESKKIIRFYYLIMSVIFIFGLVRLLVLLYSLDFSIDPVINSVYCRVIFQMIFLIFYPILFIIPMHLYIKYNVFPKFTDEEEFLPMKKLLGRIAILIAFTLITGFVIIFMQELVFYVHRLPYTAGIR